MNKATLIAAGVDYDSGCNRFMNDQELYEDVLRKFLEDGTMKQAEEAFAANDHKTLFLCVHTLKGVCGNLSMDGLYKTSIALTELLRNDSGTQAEISAGFARLCEEYAKVTDGIRSAMQQDG